MGLEFFETDVAVHQKLGDNPNTDNGLSAAAVKALFDSPAEAIKAFINNSMIPFVNSTEETASDAAGKATAADVNASNAMTVANQAKQLAQQAASLAGSGAQTFEYGKTVYAIVMVAVNAGKAVFCKRGSVVLPLAAADSSGILFAGISDPITGTINGYLLASDNTWFTYQTVYEKTEAIDADSTHEQVPTAKAVWDSIEGLIQDVADLKYIPIDVTGISATPSVAELGSTVDSVTVTWAVNREPVSLTVAGEAVDAGARSAVVPGPFTETTSFAVVATDERGATDTATTRINFYNGIYYGPLASGEVPDSAAILGLTRKLQSGKGATISYTPTDGKRPSYACPTSYGTPKFVIGGFEYAWTKLGTIQFENASGHKETYGVWQHPQDVTAAMTITVS